MHTGPENQTEGRPRTPISSGQARLAGLVAALVALAVGEVISGFAGSDQSLIGSVGTSFVDRFAASLKNFAVAVFGTNDKTALIIGIVVISVAAGAAIGAQARQRPIVGPLGFGAFGLVGLLAGWADSQTNKVVVAIAAVLAVGAGVLTLQTLFRVARSGAPIANARHPETPTDPHATRRAFFSWAGAFGAFAVTTTLVGRALSGRSKAEVARDQVKLPNVASKTGGTMVNGTVPDVAPLGVSALTPYYMPNEAFYRIDTAIVVPQVDPAAWKLKITGMVDNPFEISFDELLAMPQIEEAVTLQCVSNEIGGDLVGNARWQGVPLEALLQRAGVQPGATQIVGKSVDGWTGGFPTKVARDGRVAMVAVGMNREPLPITHGFPARLVVAGIYGYVSATKWLSEIRLTTWEAFDGYWIPRGWAKEGPIKTASRIDVPGRRTPLTAGPQKIAGIALAPTRDITKVEVQVDGDAWREATLGQVVSKNTWVQWVIDWEATPGEHRLQVRATDGAGETQTDKRAPSAPDGATGWHAVTVTVATR